MTFLRYRCGCLQKNCYSSRTVMSPGISSYTISASMTLEIRKLM